MNETPNVPEEKHEITDAAHRLLEHTPPDQVSAPAPVNEPVVPSLAETVQDAPAPPAQVVAPSQAVVEPAVQAVVSPQVVTDAAPTGGVSAKGVVLQWLSYSLWFWSLVTIGTLLASSLTYFLIPSSKTSGSYEWQLYFVAAMICLVPAAFFIDRAFAKREVLKKTGFSAVIMVVNAVFAFLSALGSAIGVVIVILQMVLSSGSNDSSKIALISTLIVALLSFMFFARILVLEKWKSFTHIFRFVMVGASVLALILTFSGPFVRELNLKNDRLVEDNLSSLADAVSIYASKQDKLPVTLDELDLSSSSMSDVKVLVSKKLVTYVPEGIYPEPLSAYPDTSGVSLQGNNSQYKYQLCATYTADKSEDYYDRYSASRSDDYQTYISTYSHPKGKVCYKLRTGY